VLPSCSSTTARSARPRPAPPKASGKGIPTQPSSAISRHSARENPSGSRVSRSCRTRATGDRSRTKSAAVLARSSWSSLSTSATPSSPASIRQPEHALGDDVELHLAGAALDRVAARAQPLPGHVELALVEARTLPAERLGPRDRDHQLHAPLVELGA